LEHGQVVLVDVDADVELVDVADDDQGFLPDHGGELPRPDVDLEDLAVDLHRGGQSLQVDLAALDLRPGLEQPGAGDGDVLLPAPLEEPVEVGLGAGQGGFGGGIAEPGDVVLAGRAGGALEQFAGALQGDLGVLQVG